MMSRRYRQLLFGLLIVALLGGLGCYIWQALPQWWLWGQRWQMALSLHISELLTLASQQPFIATVYTFLVSLSYGLLHAVGPGHGKVIMASYLSTHPTQLRLSLKLSLAAAMLQAVVAIILVSTLLMVMESSLARLNMQAQTLIKLSYLAMILLGLALAYKSIRQYRIAQKKLSFVKVGPPLSLQQFKANAVPYCSSFNTNSSKCACGHSHVAGSVELSKAASYQDYLAIVMSIGIRPCSGALMALIFAKSLNLYWLGLISALSMGLGTAIAIGLLAWLSLSSSALARRYLAISESQYRLFRLIAKLLAATLISVVGLLMLQSPRLLFSPVL